MTRIESCRFCGRFADHLDAIEGGWVPYFYDGDTELECPVCPDCVGIHLRRDELDREWELKPGHHLPDAIN